MTQDARVQEFVSAFQALRAEVEKVIVGHRDIIDSVLIGMFAGGHVLLEGVPGLGKTLLVKTLSDALELSFSRVQFTPDLMPADIIGTNMIVEDAEGRKRFQFQQGTSSRTSCSPTRSTGPPRRRRAGEACRPRHGGRSLGP